MAALMMLAAFSCNKEKKPGNQTSVKYGVDGKTPLPKAVDIGLEVDGQKVLWASFNLGASKEWELGTHTCVHEKNISSHVLNSAAIRHSRILLPEG